ncbi:MAG: 7-cyano-7-deazaguanine synthase QueC [Proteobacteria bacterium]|nr:7-cyano-7-deazaguanine synthase QueC [Pseudomonadota bacterium]
MHNGALVLFSGGQDSTTCLAWALARYARVETIGFDYGQRHAIELTLRPALLHKLRALSPDWDAKLGDDHMIDLSLLGKISDTALTRDVAITMQDNGLPNTFVPGRNLLFMTVAATAAYRRGLDVLVGGMCETDFSGYPDCRDDSMKAMQVALNLGMASDFKLETPLMWLDKAATWRLAQELGGTTLVELIRSDTHTCYLGERGALHDWGHGCGLCPACELRARGWQQFATAPTTPPPDAPSS